ncbi:MAG: hypothetical protein ACFNTA_00245 [Campylobacter sp.]|uniref:hypothetical protein n=1 Tax=Campylobacter sp. TaxID=205 RepID=UPI0036189794
MLSQRYIALSDDAFGIVRVYDINSDRVFEIDMNEVDSLDDFSDIANLKQWDSFERFLDDFFAQKQH